MTCATCGRYFAPEIGACVPCAQRASLMESRREAMRAWLDRPSPNVATSWRAWFEDEAYPGNRSGAVDVDNALARQTT